MGTVRAGVPADTPRRAIARRKWLTRRIRYPRVAHFLRVSRILRVNPPARPAGGAAGTAGTGVAGAGGNARARSEIRAGSPPQWPDGGTGLRFHIPRPSLSRGLRSTISQWSYIWGRCGCWCVSRGGTPSSCALSPGKRGKVHTVTPAGRRPGSRGADGNGGLAEVRAGARAGGKAGSPPRWPDGEAGSRFHIRNPSLSRALRSALAVGSASGDAPSGSRDN